MRYGLVFLAVFNLWLAPVAAATSPCAMHSATSQSHKAPQESGTALKHDVKHEGHKSLANRPNSHHHQAMSALMAKHSRGLSAGASHGHGTTQASASVGGDCDCCDDGGCQCQSTCHFGTGFVLFHLLPNLLLNLQAQKITDLHQIHWLQQPVLPPFRPPIA